MQCISLARELFADGLTFVPKAECGREDLGRVAPRDSFQQVARWQRVRADLCPERFANVGLHLLYLSIDACLNRLA